MSSKGRSQSAPFELIYSPLKWQTVDSTYNHWEAQTMQERENTTAVVLEQQITERYGLLISQTQLAELLGRTTEGFRYSLSYPSDQNTRALKACGRKIGRRVYYPAMEVARIIMGSEHG
jgi:hypothetical protein